MLQQLSGLDASFLYMETGRTFGHVSSILIFDLPEDDDFDLFAVYRARMERTLREFAPLTRRLVEVPFGLDHPYWTEDPDFDIEYHLRHIAVPPPGRQSQLDDLVSRLIGRPLDRSKPLWEAYVIEGLENRQAAVLTKVHHSALDGVAGAYMTQRLLSDDGDEGAAVHDHPAKSRAAVPGPMSMLGRASIDLARRPRRMLKLQRNLLSEAWRLGRDPESRQRIRGMASSVPRTPFNAPITAHRRFTFRSVPLSAIKDVKKALGVTVNDVVVAMATGALRQYLLDHDALPDQPLVAMVPVSIREIDDDPWTNRVSSIFAKLPTDLDDRADRVAAIGQTMAEAKEAHDLLPAELLLESASVTPGRLGLQAARVITNPRVVNLAPQPANVVISNVPGPREPLGLGPAAVRHYIPVSTIVDGQGLNITVQSYHDTLDIGLVACRELVPDLDHLAGLHVAELMALAELAEVEVSA